MCPQIFIQFVQGAKHTNTKSGDDRNADLYVKLAYLGFQDDIPTNNIPSNYEGHLITFTNSRNVLLPEIIFTLPKSQSMDGILSRN